MLNSATTRPQLRMGQLKRIELNGMGTLLFYLTGAVQDLLPLIPAVALLRVLLMSARKMRGGRISALHEVCAAVWMLYLLALFSQTVSLYTILTHGFAPSGRWNMLPFDFVRQALSRGMSEHLWVNIIGNILMFVPWGLLLPLGWAKLRCGARVCLGGALTSAAIEFLQAFCGRSTDIDDVLLNTLGALLGYGLFSVLMRLWPRLCEKCLQPHRRVRICTAAQPPSAVDAADEERAAS